MKISYFVYYRVAQPSQAATRATIERLLAHVKSTTGITGRLLVRTEDPSTWMEIYENIDSETAFEAALAAAVTDCGFTSIVAADSGRHIERFKAL